LDEKEGVRFNLDRLKKKVESELDESKQQKETEETDRQRADAARNKIQQQVQEAKDLLSSLSGSGIDTESVRRKEAELVALREQLEKEMEDKKLTWKKRKEL